MGSVKASFTTSISGGASPQVGKAAAPSTGPKEPIRRNDGFRPDIQALRMIAVALVVLNHLWPNRVTGGYVGVDVFFVISGFLITAHLGRELASTGRVRFAAFYARRARRLLPAALLVLCFGVVATWLFLPANMWGRGASEILASAFYVENWFLASESVDYSALNSAATVAQHYWSLSVEEQFYLFWPALLGLAWWGGRRFAPRQRVLLVSGVLTALGVLSLTASVLMTEAAPQPAYFVTPIRVWEFVFGGLLALGLARIRLPRAIAELLSYLGFLLIVVSALVYSHSTSFPGAAALVPVLGTVLVIAAGSARWQLSHEIVSARRPVQWLGDVSYSIYLWHWPLIVIAPFVLSRSLSSIDKVGIVVVALVLAGVTRRFVEIPGQRWTYYRASGRRTLIATGTGMILVALLCGGLYAAYTVRPDTAGQVLVEPPELRRCDGPNALANPADCVVSEPVANAQMSERNAYYNTPDECGDSLDLLVAGDTPTTLRCDFTNGDPDAEQIWLLGDSHAQQWQWAFYDLARQNKWMLTTSYLGGCPPSDVEFKGFRDDRTGATAERCMSWSDAVADEIAAERPDVVFMSSATRQEFIDDGSGRSIQEQYSRGFHAYWSRWTDVGTAVRVIGDAPLNGAVRDPNCLLLHSDDPLQCAIERTIAQPPDPMLIAAQEFDDPLVVGIDTTDSFCDSSQCYAAVGGVPVYFDADHLNLDFVRLMRPLFERALPEK